MRILILILLLVTSLNAETYYISNSGSDSNDGKSTSTAWATLDKLHNSWGSIVAGDSILFNRGDEWISYNHDGRKGAIDIPDGKSGTASAWIYIGAYGSGADPIIDGSQADSWKNSLFIAGAKYIEINGIYFKGSHLYRILHLITSQIGLTYYKFVNCTLEGGNMYFANTPCNDTHTGYLTGGQTHIPDSNDPYTSPIHHIEIGNSLFLNNTGEDAINLARGIRDIGGGVVVNGEVPDTNIWVHDNTFYNFEGEALDIAGGDNHLIERNIASGAYVGASGGNVFKFHSQNGEFTNSVFRNNLLMGAQWTTSQAAFGFAMWNTQGCWVYNNTVYSRHAAVVGDDDRSGGTAYYDTFEGNKFYNNVWYGSFNIQGDPGVVYSWYTHNQVDSITYLNDFKDNIFKHNPEYSESRLIRIWSGGTVDDADCIYTVEQFNTRWLGSEYGQAGSGDKAETPDLVNPTWTSPQVYGDFTPTSTGNLVDSGTVITGYNYDLNNTAVPQGNGYDIGAYEYGSGYSPGLLLASPSSWNAGTIDASDTTFSYLYISNSGDTTVTYAITFSDSTNFRLIGSGTTVSTETDTFKIVYDPSGNGTHTDSVIITHDGTNGTIVIPLTGTASTVTPASLSTTFTENIGTLVFGSELIPNNDYTNSANWSGDNPLGSTVTESGGNVITEASGARFISDGTWIELLYNSVCTSGLMYKYETTISTYTSGGIKLDAGDGAVSSDVVMDSADTFKGIIIADLNNWATARNVGGCDLIVSSQSLKQVTSQYIDTVDVTNGGTADLTGTASLLHGTNYSILSGSTIFNRTSVIVRYKPTSEGTHTDSIIIATNGGNDTLALSASWGVTTNPNFSVSKESYNFGNVDTATTIDDSVKVYNNGTGTLTGTATASGTGFSIVSGGTISISAGDSAWVVYRFSPTTVGAYSGSVEFSTNAENQPTYSYALSGVGQAVLTPPEFGISQSSYSYGTIDTSETKVKLFTVYDYGDTSLVGNVTLTDSTNFDIVSGDNYNTDSTHLVYIKFQPQDVGSYTCYAIFAHNASTSPDTLTLSGIGGEPVLVLSPTGSVDFGSVYTTQYSELTFVMENSGTGTIDGSLALSDSTYFSIQSGSVGNSTTIVIRFTPTTGGAKSATFYVYHNASNYASPIEVSLFGTGAVPGVKSRINKVTTSVFIYTPLE